MGKLEERIICDCGEKSIKQAIEIFQQTDLPYKKARKLVTGCSKTCCRVPLMRLFDMVYFGKVEIEEIVRLIDTRHSTFGSLVEQLGPEG